MNVIQGDFAHKAIKERSSRDSRANQIRRNHRASQFAADPSVEQRKISQPVSCATEAFCRDPRTP